MRELFPQLHPSKETQSDTDRFLCQQFSPGIQILFSCVTCGYIVTNTLIWMGYCLCCINWLLKFLIEIEALQQSYNPGTIIRAQINIQINIRYGNIRVSIFWQISHLLQFCAFFGE